MHLLFATNNAYVPHVATTLCSIFENNKWTQFVVHVMATDISDSYLSMLTGFVESYGHSLDVKIINPEELEIDLAVCGKWGIFPSLKLYAANLFPEVDRLLYVDADMICIGSLRPIEETDITNYYLAACTDEEGSVKHKERLGMPINAFYGCAGLVYFNLDAWRKFEVLEKCLDFFNNPFNKDIIKWGEQDVINKVCIGHIAELPIEFNMFSHYYLHHKHAIPAHYRENFQQHKDNAVIIHFIDTVKPWFRDCLFPLKSLYWKYHALTPWKKQVYGYSKCYKGKWTLYKDCIKGVLHRIGVRTYDYGYDL